MESFKGLFHHSGNCMFLICIRLWTTTTSDRIYPLNIRKRKPYKNFKIFNIESYPGTLFNFYNSSNSSSYNRPMKVIKRVIKLAKMSCKHFLAANKKLPEKTFCGWQLNWKQNKVREEEKFSVILVSKDVLLGIKLHRYKTPLLL